MINAKKKKLSDITSIRLNNLRPAQKSPGRKIVGRGPGSGLGKTSGRGHKGQRSRSGVSLKSFEGGQMRFVRRVPKRGFTNIFKRSYSLVNLDDLQRLIDQGKLDVSKVIDMDALKKAGLVRAGANRVKLLARGCLRTGNLKICMHRASSEAVKQISAMSGADITIMEKIKNTADVEDKKEKK